MIVAIADLKKLNNVLDELEKDLFFEHYKQLRLFYGNICHAFLSDIPEDPASGIIVPIGDKDKIYFDKMTK